MGLVVSQQLEDHQFETPDLESDLGPAGVSPQNLITLGLSCMLIKFMTPTFTPKWQRRGHEPKQQRGRNQSSENNENCGPNRYVAFWINSGLDQGVRLHNWPVQTVHRPGAYQMHSNFGQSSRAANYIRAGLSRLVWNVLHEQHARPSCRAADHTRAGWTRADKK